MTTVATPPSKMSDMKLLRQRLAEALARRGALVEKGHRIFEIDSPYAVDAPAASRAEVLRARAEAPDVRRERPGTRRGTR